MAGLDAVNMRDVLVSLIYSLVIHNNSLKTDEGVMFRFEVHGENHGFEKDGQTQHKKWIMDERKLVTVIAVKYHSIFVAVRDWDQMINEDMPPVEAFQNTSNHDSCWREDGLGEVHKIASQLADKARNKSPKAHQDFLTEYVRVWMPSFKPFMTPVRIEKERNETYGYTLRKIEVLPQVLRFVTEEKQEEE